MIEPFFIAVEGNIGAGKTTLARRLADTMNAQLILEQFADNPFLNEFYSNPERWAFTVEMAFMAERYQQLCGLIHQIDLFQPVFISDYHPMKSKLFAAVNLSEKEFFLYEHFFDMLFQKIRQPDLLIFLSADIDTLLHNIRIRGRSFEQNIEPNYLEKISMEYKNFLKMLNTPTIILRRESFDFLNQEHQLHTLIRAIESKPIKGQIFISDPDQLEKFVSDV